MTVYFHVQTREESKEGARLTKILPTYKDVFAFHGGNKEMEVRIRFANLQGTIEHEAPREIALLEEMVPNPSWEGCLSFGQAAMIHELQSRIDPEDKYTIDEIGLLLSAAGYTIIDGELYELADEKYYPQIQA